MRSALFLHRHAATALLLVCLLMPAAAHATIDVAVDYPGAYVQVKDHHLALYLPEGWAVETDAYPLLAQDPEGAMQVCVAVYANAPGYTMDGLYDWLASDARHDSVAPVFFSDVPFVTFERPDADFLCAATLSGDGAFVYLFTFSPGSDARVGTLSLQVMASLRLSEGEEP